MASGTHDSGSRADARRPEPGEETRPEVAAELASLWPADLFEDCERLFDGVSDLAGEMPPGTAWRHAWLCRPEAEDD